MAWFLKWLANRCGLNGGGGDIYINRLKNLAKNGNKNHPFFVLFVFFFVTLHRFLLQRDGKSQ